jgi:hypothetical protein
MLIGAARFRFAGDKAVRQPENGLSRLAKSAVEQPLSRTSMGFA